jgi:hypothetical protein
MLEDENIARSLALSSDAIAAFVVERDGLVRRSTIELFPGHSAATERRVKDAIAALRFKPARLGDMPVRQRAHYFIRATPAASRVEVPVTQLCKAYGTFAVRGEVRLPVGGVPAIDIERVLRDVAENVRHHKDSLDFASTFSLVRLPSGSVHHFTWIAPPADARAREILESDGAYGWGFYHLNPSFSSALGIELQVRERC